MIKITQTCENGHETPITKRTSKCFCGKEVSFELEKFDFLSSINKSLNNMWRYKNILPVKEENIISAGEGNTPIINLKELGDNLGINLYVKLETENPTGTFKDREASFVISRSKEIKEDNIVLQSTGNTAIAMTYYAGLADLNSYAFIPLISAYKLSIPEKKDNNKIIAVDGTPLQVKELASKFAEINHFPKISPFHERCECNATQAYEIYEEVLNKKIPMPDFYIQVVSAGMGPIGFFYGAKRLSQQYNSIKLPKIICIQNSEFAPMDKAFKENKDSLGEEGLTPEYPTNNPFEPTLHTTNSIAYYPYLKKAMQETNGLFPLVTPETTKKYSKEFSDALKKQGYELATTENASFITYAGLVELVKSGKIPPGSNVLLMLTGKRKIPNYITPDAIISPNHDPTTLLEELKENKLKIENIILGSDIKRKQLKEKIKELLIKKNIKFIDIGEDDYVEIAKKVSNKVKENKYNRGILICRTGIGMQIVANKIPGIYAVKGNDINSAIQSREVNNSNLITFGEEPNIPTIEKIILAWLDTAFLNKYQEAFDKIKTLEKC